MKDSQDWLDEIFVDWATAHGMTGATGKIKFGLNKSDKQAKSAIRKHILQEALSLIGDDLPLDTEPNTGQRIHNKVKQELRNKFNDTWGGGDGR